MIEIARPLLGRRAIPGNQEVVITAVRKSEEEPKPEKKLSYRERALELVRQKPVRLDPEALKTDLFESDEELEEIIGEIYRYRRAFKA